jgi:endoglucanase
VVDETPQASDENQDGESLESSGFTVKNGQIYDGDTPIHLVGVNWYGFDLWYHVANGLWARNYQDMIGQIQALGFNAIRIPICPETLTGVAVTGGMLDTALNPTLSGLDSLEMLDQIVSELEVQGMYFILSHHRPDCAQISELWHTDSYSEETWLQDLLFIAERYRTHSRFVGIDLKNEPHGSASWGDGNPSTDWKLAVEAAGSQVLDTNPNILLFVEGIQESAECGDHGHFHFWGGNLEAQVCKDLNLSQEKIVFSPHVYGPDVYEHDFFQDVSFPSNMAAIWEADFGFLTTQGYAVGIGEFGSKYGNAHALGKIWEDALVEYLISKEICNFFYWSWQRESDDETSGLLEDDWQTLTAEKFDNLARLIEACQMQIGKNGKGLGNILFIDPSSFSTPSTNNSFF